MTDIADLGLRVTGIESVDAAAHSMDRLAFAAGKVETSVQAATRAHNEQTRAARQATAGTANLAAQFSDIAVSLQGGQMPLTVAMQQGTQIAAIFSQAGGAVNLLRTAFVSLAGSLPVIAAIAAAGYAFQWLTSASEKTKKLTELMKEHEEQIKKVRDVWGEAAVAASKYGQRTFTQATFGFDMNTVSLRKRLADEIPNVQQSIVDSTDKNLEDIGGARIFRGTEMFKVLSQDIDSLVNKAKTAPETIIGLTRRISELGAASDNPGIRKLADDIAVAIAPVEELARAIAEASRQLKALEADRDTWGRLRTNGPSSITDMNNLSRLLEQQRIARERHSEQVLADRQAMTAKSPQEIFDAVRRQEAAIFDNDETPQQRSDRISEKSVNALAEATLKLVEAQKQRARSLDATLASQQLNLDLIGKTKGEQEGLKLEFQLTQAVMEEAARNNITVSQKELDLIKEKAAEYGKLADAIAKATLQDNLLFERSQVFRSDQDQGIAARLRSSGLPVDLESPEAQFMRQTERLKDLREGVRGFFDDIEQGIMSGDDIGKAIGKAVVNALNKVLDKFLDDIFNSIVNDIVGSPGTGGLFDKVFGGPATAAGAGSLFSVANAGGGTSTAAGFGQMLAGFGIVPDNVGAGGFAAGEASAGVAAGGSVQAQVWNFFAGKGLAPHQIAGIMGNVNAESAFNPGIKGDSGNAVGLFQWNDRKNAMMANVPNWRGNVQGQLDYAWKEMQGSESQALNALKGSTSVRGATAAFAGFERPRGFSWKNPEGADNFSGRLKGAETAFAKFGNTTEIAAKNVGQMAQVSGEATKGLGQFGNALSQFPAAPSGGGGGLGGLFRGGGGGGFPLPSFDFMSSISPDAATFILGGRVGLFHEGGIAGFATQHRYGVDPRAFIGAPRYHRGGFAGDEVPAILKRGEPVFRSMQHARDTVGGNSGLNVIVNNYSNNQVNQEQGGDNGRDLIITIDEAVGSLAQKPGSYTNKALRAGGVRPSLERRS